MCDPYSPPSAILEDTFRIWCHGHSQVYHVTLLHSGLVLHPLPVGQASSFAWLKRGNNVVNGRCCSGVDFSGEGNGRRVEIRAKDVVTCRWDILMFVLIGFTFLNFANCKCLKAVQRYDNVS